MTTDSIRHFRRIRDVSPDELRFIINKAIEIKQRPDAWSTALTGKTLAMLFQKTSTRTRFSFEVGMTQLGGHAIFAETRLTNIGIADLADEGLVISRYVDVIMARLKQSTDLMTLASASEVPVINGLDEKYHPAQALTDLMTIKEKLGRTADLKIVYVGIANNVSNSLAMAAVYSDAQFVLCVPEKDPDSDVPEHLAFLQESSRYSENPDIAEAVKDADVIYTDTWINLEYFTDPSFAEEKERRINTFTPYQVNEEMLALTGKDTLVMHCLPAHKGYEVNETVLYTPNSVVFDQAENRLHAQKALLLWLLNKL
ncbi:MAG: ornithine carbamoyltransferase [Chloroflexi bacterium]|nr:ornithine carbamoyltransferase [Chloroflexota bacterium]